VWGKVIALGGAIGCGSSDGHKRDYLSLLRSKKILQKPSRKNIPVDHAC
jgi:hypothetical protein